MQWYYRGKFINTKIW